jgi:branched-chain amino acid transport system ATP-binding protein
LLLANRLLFEAIRWLSKLTWGAIEMLKLENINVYYGNICALKGISLFVDEGELVTLLGSNGAGKTTCLQTISGLLHPQQGVITYQEEKITRLSPYEIVKRGISQSPEGRHIFSSLSVGENLMLGASQRKDKAGIAQDQEYVFSLFPVLEERINQPAGTLSGGEQQMLAIGRALMSRPRLLLLDEPSLGLAPIMVQKIFAVIQKVRQEGGTVLLVEQNARQALEIADRGYVLETGYIILEGTAQELRTNEGVEKAYLGG